MSTLKGKIIALLEIEDGFTDREITDKVRGYGKPQQSINIACRKMEASNIIKRIKRPDGKIGNFLNDNNIILPNKFTYESLEKQEQINNSENDKNSIASIGQTDQLTISIDSEVYIFTRATLVFHTHDNKNIFSYKNNKTLQETIQHHRYKKLQKSVEDLYSEYTNMELGKFLIQLKSSGDRFYQNFLNSYGDQKFCNFSMDNEKLLKKKGVYAYLIHGELKYIGRCKDSFKQRINQGYGKISPKNCYIDGQSTNCHLNALINNNRKDVKLYICEIANDYKIEKTERDLITAVKPDWNISLK